LAHLPFNAWAPLWYPLPAVLLVLPLSFLTDSVAAAAWNAVTSALLAFGLTRDGPGRLILFASAPAVIAITMAQWSPLLAATALIPALAPFAICKPTLGLALFLRRLSWWTVVGSVLLLLVSLALLPTWPLDWLRSLGGGSHAVPLLALPAGPLLLLGLLRWRDGDARLLLGLAVVPQLLHYDALVVAPALRTPRAAGIWALCSWIGVAVAHAAALPVQVAAAMVVALLYGPVLILVLWPRPAQALPDH
jgi:hypothetical protein